MSHALDDALNRLNKACSDWDLSPLQRVAAPSLPDVQEHPRSPGGSPLTGSTQFREIEKGAGQGPEPPVFGSMRPMEVTGLPVPDGQLEGDNANSIDAATESEMPIELKIGLFKRVLKWTKSWLASPS